MSRRPSPAPAVRAAAVVAGTLLAVTVASGCSQTMGGAEGYVVGSGTVTTIPEPEREPAPALSGRTLDGESLALRDYAGQAVVLNVWGSWCAPCREEAPDLAAAADRLRRQQVRFLGISVREPGVASAQAFVRNFDVPYPSIYDADGSELLGFRDTLPPDAIPSTLVIDDKGRVAARILGTVDQGTLVQLVHDVSDDA
ncbi:MAG: TlpA family protein disulfide reductase [Nocardioidaceae bacterium]